MPIQSAPFATSLGLLSAIAIVSLSCANNPFKPDQMIGCYAERENGAPEIKVTKNASEYQASVFINGAWSSTSLHHASLGELAPLFGKDTSKIAESLGSSNSPFGLFRARERTTVSGKGATEYLVFLLLVTVPAFKVAC